MCEVAWGNFQRRHQLTAGVKMCIYDTYLQSLSKGLLREKRKYHSWVLNQIFSKVCLITIILSFFYRLFHTYDLDISLDQLLSTVPLRIQLCSKAWCKPWGLHFLQQHVSIQGRCTTGWGKRHLSSVFLILSKITQGRAQREGLVVSQQDSQKPLDKITVWNEELKQ